MAIKISELVAFLNELDRNNNKAWFDAHRAQYQTLRLGFADLVQDVIIGISAFDERAQGLSAESALFRINRDLRFSRDKRPYKTNFSSAIGPDGRSTGYPSYYFSIDHNAKLECAAGVYMPPPDLLLRIRTCIANRPDLVADVLSNKLFAAMYKTIGGDALQRPPRGFDENTPNIDLIKHKGFTVWEERVLPASQSTTALVKHLIQRFEAAYPLMAWLREALGA